MPCYLMKILTLVRLRDMRITKSYDSPKRKCTKLLTNSKNVYNNNLNLLNDLKRSPAI